MFFNAKWITYPTGDYKGLEDQYGNPAPYFRHTFSLEKKVVKAELLASALGVFKFYVNGHTIGNDYLSPGWVDYGKKMPFIRYDITPFLKEDNGIGVVLGDGWAVGHVGSNTTFKRTSWSDQIELSAQIQLQYEDGTTENIDTGSHWKATTGEILRTDIYMGEYVDHRLDLGDFSQYDYNDSAWDQAQETTFRFPRGIYLEEMTLAPIVVKHTFKPTLIKQEGNSFIYDVSQNISGALRCVFEGKRGTKIKIRHGELMVDDALYTENLRKAEATDYYILSGEGQEEFRPLFTFHGFRFAEITIMGDAKILDITAEAMYTDLPKTGEFSCSDPVVNQVYSNALWSQRDNFLNVPTDCPQRDERLGWTADAQIFAQSAMYNMYCKDFYDKYLSDVRDAQLGNGVVPAVAPLPHIAFHRYVGFGPSPGWAEAIAEIPYCHYKTYGDKKVIRDNLYAIKKLLDYYESSSPLHIRRTTGKIYGDWLSLGNTTDFDAISTMYYAHAADLCAQLCEAVGDFETEHYKELFQKIKEAFNKYFVDEEGKIVSDTQSCYVISYKFGLIDAESARRNMERKWVEDDKKLTCGFLGVRFLLPALCDLGLTDIAYHLITNREYPGWGYSVMNGATTIWEHWDSYTKENGLRTGMNSFNHYSFGSCTEWMYEYCLGIRSDVKNPGFRKVIIAPICDFSGKLTWVKGYYESVGGRIDASWKRVGDDVEYLVTIPQTMEKEFRFDGVNIVSQAEENGTYRFLLRKN